MNKDILQLCNVSFAYDHASVLRNVNAEIHRGEFIGIMGPNGGGKTTFLKLLMGFLQPAKGMIFLFGKSPFQARRSIGYVPQVHRTDRDFPITLQELVLLGALAQTSPGKPYPEEIKKRANQLIEELGLQPHKHKAFGSLSGGLAQRALFARALLADPEILLLDEPTANIDMSSAALIFSWLTMWKGKKTILLVTHDLRTMTERVDRMLSVEGHVRSLYPKDICEHFALGLYHTPLMDLPNNHFTKVSHVDCPFH